MHNNKYNILNSQQIKYSVNLDYWKLRGFYFESISHNWADYYGYLIFNWLPNMSNYQNNFIFFIKNWQYKKFI